MNNTSIFRNHSLVHNYNPDNTLGRDEREMLLMAFGPQDRLDYPTEPLEMANGCVVERYVIPDEDKQKIMDMLFPFFEQPSMDDERLDIHCNRKFKVRDFMVTREGDGNFIVSPYYAEAGGTVLDWVMPEKANGDGTILSIGTIRR